VSWLQSSHPVYVCEKLSSLEVPSFISYVNAAFVRMSQYSWVHIRAHLPQLANYYIVTACSLPSLSAFLQSELIGMPFSKIFTGHERYLSQFAALLYNQYAFFFFSIS
jgi:hypothetical protein